MFYSMIYLVKTGNRGKIQAKSDKKNKVVELAKVRKHKGKEETLTMPSFFLLS